MRNVSFTESHFLWVAVYQQHYFLISLAKALKNYMRINILNKSQFKSICHNSFPNQLNYTVLLHSFTKYITFIFHIKRLLLVFRKKKFSQKLFNNNHLFKRKKNERKFTCINNNNKINKQLLVLYLKHINFKSLISMT